MIAGVLCVVAVVVTARALYLHRLWTMARIWAKLPPSVGPHPAAFFLPDARGTTAHGIYSDMVFLSLHAPESVVAPLRTDTGQPNPAFIDGCGTDDRYRLNTATIRPDNLAACYGFAGAPETATGNGFRRGDTVGGWVGTDARGFLHLAVYRTR